MPPNGGIPRLSASYGTGNGAYRSAMLSLQRKGG